MVIGVHQDIETEALIDSGAMATYIHPRLVIKLRLPSVPLVRPIPVFNVDDTPNKKGTISHAVALRYRWKGTTKLVKAYVAEIGRQDLILGHEWLQKENPIIDWKTGELEFEDQTYWAKREQNEQLSKAEILRTVKVELPPAPVYRIRRQAEEPPDRPATPKNPANQPHLDE
ncbi:hypothetical protein EVJ58_g5963 [Rhodofomes roseus]|uniref:Uncharacterized protein n=1 Tax=Rhodofomes roseus TaxID=34475 RepID=A0A4Y9YC22_9APHY|nr:hypothetical protein EVJ58_g5963 [Rhodofomes roseus]